MIEALSPLFVGNLGYLRDRLVPPDGARTAIPIDRLLEPDAMEAVVARFLGRYPGVDRRGVVSMWSQWYFGAVVVPVVAANLFLDLSLEAGAAVVIGDESHPVALRLPAAGRPLASDGTFDRFAPLVRLHLDPLIAGVARRFGVSPRLLWSNAASFAEWAAREVASLPNAPACAGARGDELFRSEAWPDGWPNPFFEPTRRVVTGTQGAPARRRRVCCLRYRLPGVADCGICCPIGKRRA